MRHAHPVAVVRAAEAAVMARLPAGTLMQRAAAGIAAVASRLLRQRVGRVYGARVGMLVGSGDNGGDALFAGARLARAGARVVAVPLGTRVHAGGRDALTAAGGSFGSAADLAGVDLVLDGIVGIGGRPGLRPEAVAALRRVPADAAVVAVDVPSGVDPDTGEVCGTAVRADVTVTFGALKPGLLIDPGAEHAGRIEYVDIGLGPFLPTPWLTVLDEEDLPARLPRLARTADKYQRGVLGVVAGSPRYTGAAVLTVGGALRTGIGMVRFVGAAEPADRVRARWPEAVVTVLPDDARDVAAAGRVQAWVVGPGLEPDDVGHALVAQVLAMPVPVVVDAGGLAVLAADRSLLDGRRAPTVLTPHAGELARLLRMPPGGRQDIEEHRLAFARRAADEFGATVLLKGTTTCVASPSGLVRVNPTGTPVLATAGSGDVLSGVIGALLAGGLSAFDAASVGAYLHGLAAQLVSGPAGRPISATDLWAALPDAIPGRPDSREW